MANHYFSIVVKFVYQILYKINHCYIKKNDMKVKKDDRVWYENMFDKLTHKNVLRGIGFVCDAALLWNDCDLSLESSESDVTRILTVSDKTIQQFK